MNRRITILSVGVACLLTLVLMGSVWLMYYSGGSTPFRLPDPLFPDSSVGGPGPGPGNSDLPYLPLTVDARNVQALLATVERPGAYRRTVEIVSYWPGGEEKVSHQWARRGGLTRVETEQPGHPVQNRIVTENMIYLWIGDTMVYHEVPVTKADAEALSGIPTWEDVAALPLDDIEFAAYLIYFGERSLLVRTREPVYLAEYVVSLETGLLTRAVFTGPDGQTAYEVNAGPPVQGDPGDGYFTLPDGGYIE
jgi:hypothetical protein